MDIGKNNAKFGSPILLTLVVLIIIPSSVGYIDCRISCRRCHENTEHPAVLEVYCAMCEECKQRRRERMLGKTKGKIKPTANPSARMRVGVEVSTDYEAPTLRPQESLRFQQTEQDSQLQYQGQPQQQYETEQQPVYQPQQPPQPRAQTPQSAQTPQPPQPLQLPQEHPEIQQPQALFTPHKSLRGMEYPAGCPTPPICSDYEDPPDPFIEPLTKPLETTTTSTTTTTTTRAPCPPIRACRKKKRSTPMLPCMNPCMVPAPMCPCPMFPPPGQNMFPPPGQNMYPPWPQFPPTGPHNFPDWTSTTQTTEDTYPFNPIVLTEPSIFPMTGGPIGGNPDFHYILVGMPRKSK